MKKQKILLGVLLVGLVFALLYAFWAAPVPESGPLTETASRAQRKAEQGRINGQLEQYRVQLGLLERGVEAFREPKRDLFQLTVPPPSRLPDR